MAKYPDKVALISDKKSRLGTSLNFGQLLEHSTAEYIMFSDQDDIWLPKKIERVLNEMKKAEQLYPNIPLLIHTDLKVVDQDMNEISESSFRYQRLDPLIPDDVYKAMVQGLVSGNTAIMNKKAKDISMPIPKEARMYDWWITINVAKYGKVIYHPESHILYRQHYDNRVGVRKRNASYFFRVLFEVRRTIASHGPVYRMLKKLRFKVSLCLLLKAKIAILWKRWVLWKNQV